MCRGRSRLRSPCIGTCEYRVHAVGCVADGRIGSHRKSFPSTAETHLRRSDRLIVQQISSVMPSCSYARLTDGRAVTLSRSFAMLGRERGGLVIGRAQRESMTR